MTTKTTILRSLQRATPQRRTSWWAETPPESFTARCYEELPQMKQSKFADARLNLIELSDYGMWG